MTNKQKRIPNLGKLSIAILENYVKPFIGEEAIKEIKSPLIEAQLRESLAKALANAENRFISEHTDRKVADAVLSLSIAHLPSIAQAVKAFHDRPTDKTLQNTIGEKLEKDWPQFSKEQVDIAVRDYMRILKKELAASILTVRETLNTLANIATEENTALIVEKLDNIVELLTPKFAIPRVLGNMPPRPSLIIGRENDLKYLKSRLGASINKDSPPTIKPLTAVRGWPGVGKTTLVSTLAHESEIALAFPDGILWTALGENPNLFSELATWGRALGIEDTGRLPTLEELMNRLAAILRDKQMLLIIDDVWEPEHGKPFKIAGRNCATIFTTRFQDVARALVDIPDEQIYLLPVLSQEKALELLQKLTPKTVKKHPDESLILVQDLEGLPLAIHVAGRLLSEEHDMGWGVAELIIELREGAKLLAANAPADRADIVNQTTPTVAALLKKSTDTLRKEAQIHFAFLGAFAPKPATFDLAAMAAVWLADDPKPFVRTLVNRGLLERIGERYQMHSLLVAHARNLLSNDE